MKTLVFDKLVSLLVDKQEEETQVVVNWVKFLRNGKVLCEKWSTLTVTKAKEIEGRYTPIVNEEWKRVYSDEDLKAIQDEAATYDTLEEVILFIDKENIIPIIEKALLLKN